MNDFCQATTVESLEQMAHNLQDSGDDDYIHNLLCNSHTLMNSSNTTEPSSRSLCGMLNKSEVGNPSNLRLASTMWTTKPGVLSTRIWNASATYQTTKHLQ